MALTRFEVSIGAVLFIPKCWTVFVYKGITYEHQDGVIRRASRQAKVCA